MRAEATAKPQIPVPFLLLGELFEHHARHRPNATAIAAPDRPALSYGGLHQQINYVGGALRAMGLARRDRVAVVLPNGPELAVAVLGVAASATCLPMNPASAAEELDKYFTDLRPLALITQVDSTARRVALSHGIRVIELLTTGDMQAGLFTLANDRGTLTSDSGSAPSRETVGPGDVALLMTTSGTTSRPKIVPSTHVNICTAACSWCATLALTETDRCLNVMPLFHGHGLIGTVLASLAAGASVICTPGCDTNKFFGWLTEFRPTWYSAVPTMHQAILAEARRQRQRPGDHRLRLVRSGSARMPAHLFAELEQTFATSVIEFCGITETAASPVACNPLPPRPRKVGSIGIPVELDVAIIDEGGDWLPSGQTGEVIVRGASLMSGYDADPAATTAAFAGNWFKTGDLGFFDEDGYLFLAGRIKEVINRGGEKIAPTQVDEVLLEHPAVAEAATFAVPHPTLGEDVAAAVVLRARAKATAQQIRQYAKTRLVAFKVPRQVLFVEQIPKGPTGKVKRVELAAKLGVASGAESAPPFVAPRNSLEEALAGIWAEVLHLEKVGIHDDFFALGGDSLMAAHLLTSIFEKCHLEVELSRFFDRPTVAEVARDIKRLKQAVQTAGPASTILRTRRRPNGLAPASIAQERLWELHHALPGLPFFNILHVLRLTSPIDVALLERSINEIVRRHEILRTTFTFRRGRCVQIIASELIVPLVFHDLDTLGRSKKQTLADKLLQEQALQTFDLAKGPLIRSCLLRLDEREHLLLIAAHQAICDGWSLGVLVDELVTLYDDFSEQKASSLAPLRIQFCDFARWQRAWRSHPEMRAQLAYWREQLRGPLPSMRFGVARAKRPIDDLRTARRALALPASLTDAARRFGRQEGGTLFMTLVAALKTLLHHYLDQDDVRVATNVANRARRETEGLIGPLVNTVVLRTDLAGDPNAREVIRRVRATCLAAFANQDLPIEYAEGARGSGRSPRSSLANVMILLQNAMLRPSEKKGRLLTLEEVNGDMLMPVVTLTTYDMILMLREGRGGVTGTCAYKPHVFSTRTIDRLLGEFEAVLEQMVAHPGRPISRIAVALDERAVGPELGVLA
jgi:acyl-CoA synthetase (AMP-forming)/AMP-acid ligase II/acyl carrier protein